MFYHFNQNSSGGSFHFNENQGITHHVIIEADNESDANTIAEEIGIYFDGRGDCECCGNRWHEVYKNDGEEFPSVYGNLVQEVADSRHFYRRMEPGKEVCVHYKDGHKEWF